MFCDVNIIQINCNIMVTLMFELGWNPSSWFSSSNIVLCTSRSPAFSLSNRLVPKQNAQ